MRRFARIAALLVAMLFLAACAGEVPVPVPEPTPTEPQPQHPPHTFTLAYCRSDSLDPFRMTGRVNRALCGLLYEGLVTIDQNSQPQPSLAESVQVNGNEVTAVLRADAVFSNGELVTAEDVVASFEAARDSAYYKDLLRRATRAELRDERTVVFTFSAEPFATRCLTFPVVRVTESGDVLGSGPYVFDPTPCLTLNPRVASASFPTVRLLDLRGEEELSAGLEMGNLSYFFSDLSSGELPRVAGATAAVPMNHLVFLGINSSREATADPAVRQALSSALDRMALAQSAYSGYAVAAGSVFPPSFAVSQSGVAQVSVKADRAAAEEALASAGYATLSTDSKGQKPLSLTLLLNNDNACRVALAQLIKTQLQAVGITVTLVELPYDDYRVALKYGRYDLYLGEVRLTENFDLSPLLTTNGAAGYGISSKNAAVKAYSDFLKGEITLSGFTEEFAASLPLLPICFRSGMAAYHRDLTDVTPTSFNVYHNLLNWKLTNQKGV